MVTSQGGPEGAVNRLCVLLDMPHVKTVAAPHEMDAVNGTLFAAWRAISERRDLFRRYDIDSVEKFRRLRAAGGLGVQLGYLPR